MRFFNNISAYLLNATLSAKSQYVSTTPKAVQPTQKAQDAPMAEEPKPTESKASDASNEAPKAKAAETKSNWTRVKEWFGFMPETEAERHLREQQQKARAEYYARKEAEDRAMGATKIPAWASVVAAFIVSVALNIAVRMATNAIYKPA